MLLLVPSLQFVWRNSAMPEFGALHDDGVLFVTARSVASGHFRLESLPEIPSATKAPPLYPLYLSLVWKLNPNFPDNLSTASWLSWLVLATMVLLVFLYFRGWNLRESRVWVLAGLVAVNPYLILFGSTMFSEIFFTCFLLALFLAIRRQGSRANLAWMLAAGLLAGCAYLARTAGIALLISVPLALATEKATSRPDWKRIATFAAGMLPAIISWTLWSGAHRIHPADQTLMYYTDYLGYQFLNVDFHNLGVVLWKNLDGLLYGMGSLALPKIVDNLPVKILTQVIAIGMISGVVRLYQRGIAREYACFGLISSAILLVWQFPPNERLVLPLLPLLIMGLVEELEHLASMLRAGFRHKEQSQRAAAVLMSASVAVLFSAALAAQLFVSFVFLTQTNDLKAAKLRDQRAAYAWIDANLPRDANVLSYDDPLLYLYAHRRGNYLPLLPRWWYADDHAAMIDAYRHVADYCAERHLQYFYFTTQDLARETGEDDRRAIEQTIRANPRLTPIYQYGIGTVYRVNAPAPAP